MKQDLASQGVAATLMKPIRQTLLYNTLITVLHLDVPTVETNALDLPPSDPNPDHVGRGLRILVAEDNSVNQRVAVGLLGRLGHRADVAATGEEALEAVQKFPYDLILMDIQMPEMDGLQATRAIREMAPPISDIPIVAMTASAMKNDRDRCLSAGMDGYLSKPVDRAKVADEINRLCPPEKTAVSSRAYLSGLSDNNALVFENAWGATPLIDEAGLIDLTESLGNEEIESLLGEYLSSGREVLPRLEDLCAQADWKSLEFEAHSFKGTSQNLRIVGVSRLASALEKACKENRTEDVPQIISALRERFEVVAATLQRDRGLARGA